MTISVELMDMIGAIIERHLDDNTVNKHNYVLLVFDPLTNKCDFVSSFPPKEAVTETALWLHTIVKNTQKELDASTVVSHTKKRRDH